MLLCHRAEPGAAQEAGTIHEGVGDVGEPDRADCQPWQPTGMVQEWLEQVLHYLEGNRDYLYDLYATNYRCCRW